MRTQTGNHLARQFIKRETAARFFDAQWCSCCKESKPKGKGGQEQPGRDKYHRGPWFCDDCVDRKAN